MTYSIVARDPQSGEMGVAVQSHWFSVGPIVPWAEAGVGVVATQSFVEPAYGPRGLDLMRSGLSASEALAALLQTDEGREVRQVAMVDVAGRVAAHTGTACIESAGHHPGEGYSVQANMMRNDDVVPAMSRAFEASSGPLPERLVGALRAAQDAGGDIRGRQSAAITVVGSASTGRVWADRVVELRVEDHAAPVVELARLLGIHRAYEQMNAGDAAMESGDMGGALDCYAAAAALVPDNIEVRFWNAVTLANNERLDDALPIFGEVFAADASWRELLQRLPRPDLMAQGLVDRVLGAT